MDKKNKDIKNVISLLQYNNASTFPYKDTKILRTSIFYRNIATVKLPSTEGPVKHSMSTFFGMKTIDILHFSKRK